MLDELSWKLRKLFCVFKRSVLPDQWLMNLDLATYTSKETPDLLARQRVLLEQFPHFNDLPLDWAWVRLESLYQLDQLATLLDVYPLPKSHTCTWVDVGSKNGAT